MTDCDFDNEALTCPRCGFVAGGRSCAAIVRARRRQWGGS